MISIFLSGLLKMITIDSRAALMLEIEQIVVIEELVKVWLASKDYPSLFYADGVLPPALKAPLFS
jgi:hypothetical protein